MIADAVETKRAATPSTFDLWAAVYDTQLNPFLSLEERILSALLPDLRGRDVLDAGCGTGRLFGLLKSHNARCIVGVDSSEAMLQRASHDHTCEVRCGSCTSLPVAAASIDFVVSSFVLSYVDDLDAFADQLVRVTRPGATVLLSDVHPGTASALQWKRSFRLGGQEIEVASEAWQIDQIRRVFATRGFRIRTCIEPSFTALEQRIFAQSGRAESFTAMQRLPAIYILEFVRDKYPRGTSIGTKSSFTAVRCALTAHDAAPAMLTARGGKVERLDSRPHAQLAQNESELNLSGYLVLPGLINAHDHLEFGLFPRLGHGPYQNASEWAEDIHRKDATIIARHRGVPRNVRIWWGAIRNLLAGVTTVCHHNPLTREMLHPEFPVTVLQDFQWAHSLAVNGDVTTRLNRDIVDQPFIIHAAEGDDASSAGELQQLVEQGVIDARTILVHGLALPLDAIAKLNESGAALITCPSSNAFLFNRVPSAELLSGIRQLALGSDSPLTATGDLLDELQFARNHTDLSDEALFRMVTLAPAAMLRLKRREGQLTSGSAADFIATRDRSLSPGETLAQMTSRDVELVVRSGKVFLASDLIFQRLPEPMRIGLDLLIVDGERRWIRAPLAFLFREAASVMDRGVLVLAGKKVAHGRSA
jgi:cytosine/adenosine deaminase-related metal-dependent hydrolase/ubiquinone/menaquinone biosynthesis C-methylase UbiE